MLLTILVLALLAALAAYLYTPDKPRAALEAQYAQSPSTFQGVAGIRLHLRDTGAKNAPTLILLHGFGSSLHTWDAWAQALQTDHRVIRFDLPGFGLTGPDATGDYSDTRAIAIILALMDQLHVAKATLIGNSMGGRIAWRFSAAHPERTEKLVLISPDGFASPGIEYDKPPAIPALMRILPYVLPTLLLRINLAPSYADPTRLQPITFERYRDMMLTPGNRQAILDRMAQMTLPNPIPLLRTIAAPTLLLWGERDAMIPFRNAADYQAALPHATLAPLPTLGHVPQEEAPNLSLIPVQAFLAP